MKKKILSNKTGPRKNETAEKERSPIREELCQILNEI